MRPIRVRPTSADASIANAIAAIPAVNRKKSRKRSPGAGTSMC
jgi:hypothetical protein